VQSTPSAEFLAISGAAQVSEVSYEAHVISGTSDPKSEYPMVVTVAPVSAFVRVAVGMNNWNLLAWKAGESWSALWYWNNWTGMLRKAGEWVWMR
jgi:hypothetical protein